MRDYILYPVCKLSDIIFKKCLPAGLPVLLYHRVTNKGSRLAVRIDNFEEQIKLLKRAGYGTIKPDEMIEGDLKNKVLITFDDGWRDNLINAAPVLRRYGFTATIFIATGYTGQPAAFATDENDKKALMLNEAELLELGDLGWTIANHFQSHRNIKDLSAEEIFVEFDQARQKLTGLLKKSDAEKIISYPHYQITQKNIESLRGYGVETAFGGKNRIYYRTDSRLDIPRIEIYPATSLFKFKLSLSPTYNFLKYKLLK